MVNGLGFTSRVTSSIGSSIKPCSPWFQLSRAIGLESGPATGGPTEVKRSLTLLWFSAVQIGCLPLQVSRKFAQPNSRVRHICGHIQIASDAPRAIGQPGGVRGCPSKGNINPLVLGFPPGRPRNRYTPAYALPEQPLLSRAEATSSDRP